MPLIYFNVTNPGATVGASEGVKVPSWSSRGPSLTRRRASEESGMAFEGGGVAIVPFAMGAVLLRWSALVTTEYWARIVTRGNVPNWSEAIGPLRQCPADSPNDGILGMDWGIPGQPRTLGRGQSPLQFWEKRYLDREARNPNYLFVTCMERGGLPDEKYAALRSTGMREELVAEVADRNGPAVFRVVRWRHRRRG